MKFDQARHLIVHALSPPSRGAWIEINSIAAISGGILVAPLAGGVD